jgi:hypothetical protein
MISPDTIDQTEESKAPGTSISIIFSHLMKRENRIFMYLSEIGFK